MRGAALFSLFTAWAVMLAGLLATPALAHGSVEDAPKFAPACHAASGLARSFKDMEGKSAWNCTTQGWTAHEPVAWLRFERSAWAGEALPRYFYSRIARHKSITFTVIDDDGGMRTARFLEAEGKPFAAGPVFQLALPEITPDTAALLVRVERPHSIPLLTEARITHYPEEADWSQLEVMILALVIGMLLLPLFFDISFFVVLRERFVLLHAAMVVSMMAYVLFAGGLISVFAQVPLIMNAIAGPLAWALGTGLSALFFAEFLEDDAQSPLMRRVTIGTGIWMICVPGFFAFQLHATQAFDDRAYFYCFVPAILIMTAAIAEAVGRGSRSARFIAVAWTPIILASIERLFRGLGVYVAPSAFDQGMYLASGLEVIMISLAIGDRFLAIRRERDAALTEARMLEQLSERDALTGLLNRRGLEAQFPEFARRGFGTFALVDLDRFKQVNDVHGHQTGDAALVACAEALRADHDPDLIAARLGGEEFVVLIRGADAVQRAEALRQSIPLRILADVEGLATPVTASMGLIEMPRHGKALMNFDEFYARADALMYEAKASGRNRMSYERMTLFGDAPEEGKSATQGKGADEPSAPRAPFKRRALRDRRSNAA